MKIGARIKGMFSRDKSDTEVLPAGAILGIGTPPVHGSSTPPDDPIQEQALIKLKAEFLQQLAFHVRDQKTKLSDFKLILEQIQTSLQESDNGTGPIAQQLAMVDVEAQKLEAMDNEHQELRQLMKERIASEDAKSAKEQVIDKKKEETEQEYLARKAKETGDASAGWHDKQSKLKDIELAKTMLQAIQQKFPTGTQKPDEIQNAEKIFQMILDSYNPDKKDDALTAKEYLLKVTTADVMNAFTTIHKALESRP